MTWERMGPGGFCGLQNRLRRLNCRWVGSIPTRTRHMNNKASEVFTLGAFFLYNFIFMYLADKSTC